MVVGMVVGCLYYTKTKSFIIRYSEKFALNSLIFLQINPMGQTHKITTIFISILSGPYFVAMISLNNHYFIMIICAPAVSLRKSFMLSNLSKDFFDIFTYPYIIDSIPLP